MANASPGPEFRFLSCLWRNWSSARILLLIGLLTSAWMAISGSYEGQDNRPLIAMVAIVVGLIGAMPPYISVRGDFLRVSWFGVTRTMAVSQITSVRTLASRGVPKGLGVRWGFAPGKRKVGHILAHGPAVELATADEVVVLALPQEQLDGLISRLPTRFQS